MNHQTNQPRSNDLVVELIGAIQDLHGLDHLNHNRLAALTSAAVTQLGPRSDFARACHFAWELARPPVGEDLDELSDWINWDDEGSDAVDLDLVVETLAAQHAELVADIRSIAEGRPAA